MVNLIPFPRRARSRRGLSAIEAAMVMPLFILLLFGLIEYGWIYLKSQEIANTARHGARLGILETATTAGVTTACDQLMTDAGLDGSGYTVVCAPADVSAMAPGDTLTITVTVPYSNIELTGIPLIPVPANLVRTTSMAKEGPQ